MLPLTSYGQSACKSPAYIAPICRHRRCNQVPSLCLRRSLTVTTPGQNARLNQPTIARRLRRRRESYRRRPKNRADLRPSRSAADAESWSFVISTGGAMRLQKEPSRNKRRALATRNSRTRYRRTFQTSWKTLTARIGFPPVTA